MSTSNIPSEQPGFEGMSLDNETTLPKVGFIGTVPRSGTWYLSLVLRFYNELSQGKPLSVPSRGQNYVQSQVALGVDHIAVFHAICPGFRNYRGPYRQAWERLTFFTDGFDVHRSFMETTQHLLDPASNPNARIGYQYRNPLDQAVSFYNHARRTNRLGQDMQAFSNPRDFYLKTGLDSYIKQFLSYKVMQEQYPEQVKLFRYEDLIASPKPTLVTLLRFLGHDPSSEACQARLDFALEQTSIDSVKKIEQILGHSLADDQKDPRVSHVKDGRVGKWNGLFTAEDLSFTEKRLAEFDIKMDMFTWE